MNEISFETMELLIQNREARLERIARQFTQEISFGTIIDIAEARMENAECDTDTFCTLNNYPILEGGVEYE